MILILSEEIDQSTNDVIDWLLYWKASFLRINDNDTIQITNLTINDFQYDIFFTVNNQPKIYSINQFKSYWYRRGDVKFNNVESKINGKLSYAINDYLKKEQYKLREFFISQLDNIPNKIGGLYDLHNNKLKNLVIASKCGLKIPDTQVITNKKQLQFLINKKKYISKSLYNNFDFKTLRYHIKSYTSIINNEVKDKHFFPSLVQELIEKSVDVRVFYLKKKIWSIAIFSQNDVGTKTDYRRYNYSKPNRMSPISLPKSLQINIIKFMMYLKLDTGSLDFALSKKNDFIFFEVNPVGHFGANSFFCGLNLEKEIAKRLIK